MGNLRRLSFLLTFAAAFAAPAFAGGVPEPEGYRLEAYKAPVPETLKGARVVSTAEAQALWRDGKAVFFDVMPYTPKPAGLPEGTVWKAQARRDIPGSIWLANVGYGDLNEETAAFFRDALARETGGNKERPILFYCMTDCWMSWNAGRRAVELGYSSVIWYPAGADGWEAENLPLEEGKPQYSGGDG